MFVARAIIVVAFSISALSIFAFQGVELVHAISDLFSNKKG
ncbi:hypothetical protein [Terribacillus halophilus]|jgi:hypothetical protein|nr:hypothetical protein [Terribacillus halophilus]